MALPLFPPERDPGPDFVGLLRLTVGPADARRARPRRHAVRRAPRHHRGGPALRRRRRDGRRPPGHRGQHHRPPRHGEGLPGRPLLGGGHRRDGRHGGRDGPPLPGPARALREGRGRRPSRLEGKANQLAQMVRQHLPLAMQGLAVVPLFAGYDTRPRHRAHLQLRRHRRPLRGHRLPGHRLGRPRRPQHHQARAGARAWPRTRRSTWPSSPSTRRPTRTPATGGPDLVRGIYPIVAVVDADGLPRGARGRGGRALRRPDRRRPSRRSVAAP